MIIQRHIEAGDLHIRQLILEDIHKFLIEMNNEYTPHLSMKVDLRHYAEKIYDNAVLFAEECNLGIVGMVVLYCNDENNERGYIPLVGVLPAYQRQGIAKKLMQEALSYAKSRRFKVVGIHSNNPIAIEAYCKIGFNIVEEGERKYMELKF